MEKNNKNLNVPNLRFPEFSGEWDNGTLQSVAALSKGTGISKDQLSEEGQPCILYGELYTKYRSEIIDTIISKTDIDPKKLVTSQSNDVIIPCSGESAVDIATARCVKQSNILLGGDLNIIRLKGEHDGSFFAYQLNGRRKYDIAKVAQGVSVVHLYGEHLKGVKVNYPSAAEQKKISSLLALIDQRIETQKKIIEDLKKLKDAINYNNLFDQSWKEYKISEISVLGRGRVISTIEISKQKRPQYPVYSSQTSNNGIMGYLDDYDFDGEYITWTTDGANAGTVFYRNGRFNCTNVCGTIKVDKNIDAYFLSVVLQSATAKYVSINLANPKLMNNTMASIKVKLPDIDTQKYWSRILRHIDKKIETEFKYENLLIQQKAYLLSQMFI